MVDKVITVGETLDLTYLVSDSELANSSNLTIDSTNTVNKNNIKYTENLLWTPVKEDAGETYTFTLVRKNCQ